MAVDTNYFIKPGEDTDAYNKRVAEYNASKTTVNPAPDAAQPPAASAPVAPADPKATPTVVPAAPVAPIAPAAPVAVAAKPYTVQAGDTLGAIALKFGVPIQSISGYRSGDPNKIFPGETLSIGGTEAAPPQKPAVPAVADPNADPNAPQEGDALSKMYMDAFLQTMKEDGAGGGLSADQPDPLSQYGVDSSNLPANFQENPAQTVKDLVTQVMQATGLPEAKSAITDLAKQIEDLQNERDDQIQAINDNPFLSASSKQTRIQKLTDKYENKIGNRTNYLKLVQDSYDSARQEAQFAATTAINLYDRNRNFDQGRLEFSITQAEKRLETIRDMTKLNPAQYKEVNGGLYDLGTRSWIVEPTQQTLGGLSKDQRTYLNQIQDNARQDQNIKDFPAIRASFETARSAVAKRSGAGDIVLMRMLAKITDPTTGVREEEFRTFAGAQSTLSQYGIKLTKQMWSGDRLTDGGRLSLYQQVKDIYNQRLGAYENSYDFFDNQAVSGGLPSGAVMPSYVAPDQKTNAPVSSGNGWF